MEEILYWKRKIETRQVELDRPFLCENKFGNIIEEELFKNLKAETEGIVKDLAKRINHLKAEINANSRRLSELNDGFERTREKLVFALESEKKEVKAEIRNLSNREFGSLENKGKALKEGLEMQLKHCEAARERLIEQYNELYQRLHTEKRNKEEKLSKLENDIQASFEGNGNATLARIEANYKDIVLKLENEETGLKNNKYSLSSAVKEVKDQQKNRFNALYCKLKSEGGGIRKRQVIGK